MWPNICLKCICISVCSASSSSTASAFSASSLAVKCVIYVCAGFVWPLAGETGSEFEFDLRGIVIDVLAVGFAGPGAAVRDEPVLYNTHS